MAQNTEQKQQELNKGKRPNPVAALKAYFHETEFDRLYILLLVLGLMTLLIVGRLFSLQILDYQFYAALASDQHQIRSILQADRGDILMHDTQSDTEVPVATDKPYKQVYAVPREIENPEESAERLAKLVEPDEEELLEKFQKEDDPYEMVEERVSLERFKEISHLELRGIRGVEQTSRYYIDDNVGSHPLGFVGVKDDEKVGLYGIEGHFDSILSGQKGRFSSERDVAGRWIALSDKDVQEAQDGSDIMLTLDHTLQYVTCTKLNEAVQQHGAQGGAVVIMQPDTGEILSMCSAPDFNLNYYSDVEDSSVYNNKAIFEAYEPGSIFKPVVMSAAIDLEYVTPDSRFEDTGSIKIDDHTIKNADEEVHGEVDMAEVLEKSINTGMIHVARQLGQERFRDYIERFGFGEPTGIELQTESSGTISSIHKKSEVYMATASFGQGITATPIQMVSAYAPMANGGKLMKPYIVDEIRHPDGSTESREPTKIRQVLSKRTSVLMNGMLTSVVSNGHAGNAGVDGYYIAGKTGTAQIAGSEGDYLEDETNHSFVGFGPADDPEFAMIVKLEKPKSASYSASTAAPLFSDLAEFFLDYYEIPPDY